MWWAAAAEAPLEDEDVMGSALYDRPINRNCLRSFTSFEAGRRIRVLACLVHRYNDMIYYHPQATIELGSAVSSATYGSVLSRAQDDDDLKTLFSELPIVDSVRVSGGDAQLHPCLQDLATDFYEDSNAACDAFDNPGLYYPGVDPPLIEPVTDEHVHTVIKALQRELDREKRSTASSHGCPLPGAPLAKLPFAVQRALVERRRYRFAQYGITPQTWRSGVFSLWNVALDEEWMPRTT